MGDSFQTISLTDILSGTYLTSNSSKRGVGWGKKLIVRLLDVRLCPAVGPFEVELSVMRAKFKSVPIVSRVEFQNRRFEDTGVVWLLRV